MQLDRRDRAIIGELQKDGRLTNVELAARVGMSPSNCLRKVRMLEAAGVIRGYTALIDAGKAGYAISVHILVNLNQRLETDEKSFLETIAREARIVECAAVTGAHDFLIKAIVEDMESLRDLTMNVLLGLPSVTALSSSLTMKVYKQAHGFVA